MCVLLWISNKKWKSLNTTKQNAESSESLNDDEKSSMVATSSENAGALDGDSEDEAPHVPTYLEARQGLECRIQYLYSKESTTEPKIDF